MFIVYYKTNLSIEPIIYGPFETAEKACAWMEQDVNDFIEKYSTQDFPLTSFKGNRFHIQIKNEADWKVMPVIEIKEK